MSSSLAYLSPELSFPTTIRSLTAPATPPCTELPGELWVPIKGTDCSYFVSNMGRVLSRRHYGHPKWGLLNPGRSGKMARRGSGYPQVVLYVSGRKLRPKVHRLVAESFVPNPGGLPQVDHLNGDTTDNRAENLEWVDNTENMRRAKARAGKLNPEKVARIRADWETWKGTKEAFCIAHASEMGVCLNSIKNVLNGCTWR